MGHRILVVEDDGVIALYVEDVLRRLGHDVVGPVSTAGSALRSASSERPDLVLMDIRLGRKMSGINTAARIRHSMNIPVIFVTAHSDESTLRQAKGTEPYGFVLKPFDENDLRIAIDMAIHKHGSDARLKRSEQRFATTLRAIREAVIATDVTGAIDFLNAAAEELAGIASSDALGKPLTSLLKLLDAKSRQPLALDQPWNGEALLVNSSGDQVPVAGSIATLTSHKDEATGRVLVLRNVTEERRLAELRERQRVEQIIAEVSEAEHQRFGQDLHDGLGQMLTGIASLCKALEEKLASKSLPESEDAGEICRLIGETTQSARELARGLLPVPAQPEGLVLALQRLANQVTSQFQIQCNFQDDSSVRLSASIAANHLFRIAQEAATNAVKHANAKRIDIRLHAASDKSGRLIVQDDGRGIPANLQAMGHGVDIMRYRAAAIGGRLKISAEPGGGTVVTCLFPLSHD